MAGINVMVADPDEGASRQFTTVEQMFLDIRSGRTHPIQPPVDPDSILRQDGLRIQASGSPEAVKQQMAGFQECMAADELITVTYAFDPAVRNRSVELLA